MGPNTLKIFNMNLYKEKRNFEVNLRCAFFDFRQVLLSAVKILLEFEIYLEGPISSSRWIGSHKWENKNPSPLFLEVQQSVYHFTHTFLSRGRNFKRAIIQSLRNGHSFPRIPKKRKSNQWMRFVTSQGETFSSHYDGEK